MDFDIHASEYPKMVVAYTLLLVAFQMTWFPIFQLASRLFWLAFDIFSGFLVVFWDFIPIFQLASRLFQLAFGMFSVEQ